MNEARVVRVAQAGERLRRDQERAAGIERAHAIEDALQVIPREELGDQIQMARGLVDTRVEASDNMVAPDRARCLGLALEAPQRGVARLDRLGVQDLDSN